MLSPPHKELISDENYSQHVQSYLWTNWIFLKKRTKEAPWRNLSWPDTENGELSKTLIFAKSGFFVQYIIE